MENVPEPTKQSSGKSRLKELLRAIKDNPIIITLCLLLVFGFVLILTYAPLKKQEEITFWIFVSTSTLIAGASTLIGCLTGFLFGIPKIRQGNIVQVDEAGNAKTKVESNNSLEQLSDWLTKIIVGLGLTQLGEIPGALNAFGDTVSPALGGDDSAKIFGIAVSLFYLIDGFLISYLWTAIYYRAILQDVENNSDEGIYNNPLLNIPERPKEVSPDNATKNAAAGNNDAQINNDPQKGNWGGKQEANDRRITASVVAIDNRNELFKIILQVVSVNTKKPLEGFVRFHLHPTFPNAKPIVKVIDGKATLELIAWGAFTVGAEADNGETKLEIDLATDVPDAPAVFRGR